ncbi:MAG: potassium channel family protein [Sphingomonadales bacterium]|nr:potassium channel family protein [Sphingomonadales bacterium]
MAKNVATDHALERLIFFSDAVFAIAITLLIIEIHPPHLPHGASDLAHWQALADLIPNFIGYAVSFTVIGLFWMGHHRSFALAARYDPRILGWNMWLLATIAFMPFVTAYLSAHFTERVPTFVYCVVLLVAAMLNLKVNSTATSPPMAGKDATPEIRAYVRQRGLSVVLGALTAIGLTLVVAPFGQLGLISIPFWRLLLAALGLPRMSATPAP